MMVPASRLLLWTGAAVLPLATLFTALPGVGTFCGSAILMIMIVVLIDAILSQNALKGIEIVPPELIRISKGREDTALVEIKRRKTPAVSLRIGFSVPGGLSSRMRIMTVNLPAGENRAYVEWPVKAIARGEYILNRCYLETPSRFGFWAIRASTPVNTKVRVYPDLRAERRNLAALFMNKGFGAHHQRRIGKGRDFEQLRDYLPGDCFEDIHWKATARHGRPVTKVFQVERAQEIYTIIDVSRLSARTDQSPDGTKSSYLDRHITASLVLSMAAERQGDLFGLLTFADGVEGFVRAGAGKSHYAAFQDVLNTPAPKPVSPDFDELFSFISLRIRRRSLLIILTGLDDPMIAESFIKNVDIIAKKHLVLVVSINPPGVGELFETGPVESAEDIYARLGGHLIENGLRQTEKRLKRRGVAFRTPDSEKLCPDIVSQYIRTKKRQIL